MIVDEMQKDFRERLEGKLKDIKKEFEQVREMPIPQVSFGNHRGHYYQGEKVKFLEKHFKSKFQEIRILTLHDMKSEIDSIEAILNRKRK